MHRLPKTAWWSLRRAGLLLVAALFLFAPDVARAEGPSGAELELMREVMPGADNFSKKGGQPPVFKAYRTGPDSGEQELVGYVFATSDVPPEEAAYSGTIDVLVGMDLTGTLTGVRVLRYREAISRILGDFLRRRGFQEQFAGKSISDPFRVGGDVDGITRATISIRAMARGVRNAARRVAVAYLLEPQTVASDRPTGPSVTPLERLARLSWPELLGSGLLTRVTVSRENVVGLDLSFAYVGNQALGELLLGPGTYEKARKDAGERAETSHLMLVGIDGTILNLFLPERLAVRQGTETFPLSRDDFIFLGEPEEGKIAGQVAYVGVVLIDRTVDLAQPFTISNDLRPNLGLFSNEYSLPADVLALVQGRPAREPAPPAEAAAPGIAATNEAPPGSVSGDESVAPPAPGNETPEGSATENEVTAESTPSAPGSAATNEAAPGFTFSFAEDDTVLSRLFQDVAWARVGALLALFGLGMYAFLRKNARVRWIALVFTLVYLGFIDGGFLSVSHITSGLKVGASVFLNDLPLLLIAGFTAATALLWGRVFCGFLCPFGALQGLLERMVPRRFRLEVPQGIPDWALYIKYGILALILVMALVQSDVILLQYFEPFGTVFYMSPSVVLWAILLGFLAASAIIPKFYCRYACPLGAALGLASLLTLFRIKRVGQCGPCKVCEQVCPAEAIRGPKINFKECVRCDICEVKLMTLAGTCRHSMEEVRLRLKNWRPVSQ